MTEKRYKILVVDDEPDLESLILQKFRRKIRSNEFAFVFAHNGHEALTQLRTHPDVDLVLTDINMPEMDGLTLLSHLAELKLVLKSVVVSAYGDLDNIRTAMNRGAFDFVTKPINFQDLEITIAKTLDQVYALKQALIAREQLSAMQREMQVAGELQKSILPTKFPEIPCLSLYAQMLPAKEVGGDFYDFFNLDADRIGLVMADVSGKGAPAAIFMAVSRTLLRLHALQGLDPGECLRHVNELLSLENPAAMFVTTFYGVFNYRTGELRYANAGHNPPYRLSARGQAQSLARTGGVALGVMEGLKYGSRTFQLEAGDHLLLYTDGITEAMDPAEALYGEERLEVFLEQHAQTSNPETLINALVQAVQAFASGAPQADDMTLLALHYHPQNC